MTATPLTDAAYKSYKGLVRAHIAAGPLLGVSRSLEQRLAYAVELLDRIAEFGKQNPGYGYTCAKMAQEALPSLRMGKP